jgi:hypothetical protein
MTLVTTQKGAYRVTNSTLTEALERIQHGNFEPNRLPVTEGGRLLRVTKSRRACYVRDCMRLLEWSKLTIICDAF